MPRYRIVKAVSKEDRNRINRQVKQIDKLTSDQIEELTQIVEYVVTTNSTNIQFSNRLSEKLQKQILKTIDDARALATADINESVVKIELTPDTPKEKKRWTLLGAAIALGLTSYVSRAVMQRTLLGKEVPTKAIVAESKKAIKRAADEAIFDAYTRQYDKDLKEAKKQDIKDSEFEYLQQWITQLCARTCDVCRSMNGKTIGLNESFPNPPRVHLNCKCFLTIIKVAK